MILVRFDGREAGSRQQRSVDVSEHGKRYQAPSLAEESPTSLLTSSTSQEGTSVSEANKHVGRNNRPVGFSARNMVEGVGFV